TAGKGASANVTVANTNIPVSTAGLTVGTYYAYAVDGTGNVSPKGTNPIIVYAPIINPPADPGNLTANAVSATEIDLTWTDNSVNEDNFKIETSTNGSTWTPLATLNANSTQYANTGLTEGTLYYYRIYATNGGGNSNYSGTATATTLYGPPTVTALTQIINNLGQSAKIQSNKANGSVYIVLSGIAQSSVADLDAAVTAFKGAKATVTAAGTDIPVSAKGLTPGMYYAYAVAGTSVMSAKGANVITVTGTVMGTVDLTDPDALKVYSDGSNLVIELNSKINKATAEILDLTGRKIATCQLQEGTNLLAAGVKGIFLIRLEADGAVITKKVFLP
ncbi:MAG TPA: fibronectin type III domain-containing protein, partial [Bacteroidales bacterium]